ncbi:endonuclease/exonuclease/phosphatase family protein [Streptomyces roseifaciens]
MTVGVGCFLDIHVICVVTAETIDRTEELLSFLHQERIETVAFNIEEREGVNTQRPLVTQQQARGFWRRVIQDARTTTGTFRVRELGPITRYLQNEAEFGTRDPMPTVSYNGDLTLLSPELAGLTAPEHRDFVVGSVLDTPLRDLIAQGAEYTPQVVPPLEDGQQVVATADTSRLVTYNILTGGIDKDGSERRRKRQLTFLDSLQADVIALKELRGWDAGGWRRLWEAANRLRMVPLPPVISRRGRGNHLALFYRPATVQVVDYEADPARGAFYHGVGRARLVIRDHPVLTVLFTHLCFLGGTERYAEAQWLTGYGDTYEGDPQRVVLLGDLNTIGARDREPDWERIPANLRSRHCHLTPTGACGQTDRRAIHLLENAGFRDPYDLLGLDPQRTAGYWSDEELLDHRSDFALANQNLARSVTRVVTHDTASARALSDHLPVELHLTAPAASTEAPDAPRRRGRRRA